MDLVFTPDRGYFLIHPMGRTWRGVPQVLSAKFKDGAPDRVATIHCLTFGENGAFFMSWTSTDGTIWKWISFNGQYASLKAWLEDKSKEHKSQHLLVVLGPNNSHFALSRGVGIHRCGLPDGLAKTLNTLHNGNKSVRRLQLGANGSYWMEASDGSRAWNLMGCYPDLQAYLKQHDRARDVASVNLNPFDESQYFLVFKNSNHARWNLPSTWAPDIEDFASQYKREHALSSGSTDGGMSPGRRSPNRESPVQRSKRRASPARQRRVRARRSKEGLDMGEVLFTVGQVAGMVGAVATIAGSGCIVM